MTAQSLRSSQAVTTYVHSFRRRIRKHSRLSKCKNHSPVLIAAERLLSGMESMAHFGAVATFRLVDIQRTYNEKAQKKILSFSKFLLTFQKFSVILIYIAYKKLPLRILKAYCFLLLLFPKLSIVRINNIKNIIVCISIIYHAPLCGVRLIKSQTSMSLVIESSLLYR